MFPAPLKYFALESVRCFKCRVFFECTDIREEMRCGTSERSSATMLHCAACRVLGEFPNVRPHTFAVKISQGIMRTLDKRANKS